MRIPQIKSWDDWGKIYTNMEVWEPVVREIFMNDFRVQENDLVLLKAGLTEEHLFLKEKNGH